VLDKRLLALPFAALMVAASASVGARNLAQPMPSFVPPPEVAANPANKLTLQLSNGGTVVIQLRPDLAPNHIERMRLLVRRGFYDGLNFHRVVPGFMAQGGDPTGTGVGGSDLPDIKAEITPMPFLRGTVGAARTDQLDTANSQFFIMFVPNAELDNKYTVIGRVVSGMDAVDKIVPGEPPREPTRIVKATLGG
jgi:cyclophilin family peptidyl-prolyl cis-trans isomerase